MSSDFGDMPDVRGLQAINERLRADRDSWYEMAGRLAETINGETIPLLTNLPIDDEERELHVMHLRADVREYDALALKKGSV